MRSGRDTNWRVLQKVTLMGFDDNLDEFDIHFSTVALLAQGRDFIYTAAYNLKSFIPVNAESSWTSVFDGLCRIGLYTLCSWLCATRVKSFQNEEST